MSTAKDLRQAIKLLWRTPGLTAVALLSIAITVGATAIVFAAVKSVLIDPLPFARPHELVQLRTDYATGGKSRWDWVSWQDMQDVTRTSRTLQNVGVYSYALFNLSLDRSAPPEALFGLKVSANLLPALGVTPMLGRNILPEEDRPGHDHEIILSYRVWQRRFNSGHNVIGRSIEVNGHPCVIIGVMPPAFDFPMRIATTVRTPSGHMDFWAPLGVDAATLNRNQSGYGAVARLRPGFSESQAEQDLQTISQTLSRQYPVGNTSRSLHLMSLRDRTIGSTDRALLLLFGAVLLFMLIGCANVANMLLARALGRQREIAIRLALGASRAGIVRQLVTESCVLAVAGGLAGYALTVVAWNLLPAISPLTIPRLAETRPDWLVFAFTLGVSLLNGILFGIAPAVRAARRDPALSLRESGTRGLAGGSRNRLRSALVIGEVAVAVALVVVGALLAVSFARLIRTSPGFEADRVLASIIIPSGDRYKDLSQRASLFRGILNSVRALPGVESAGLVDALPFSGERNGGIIGTSEAGDRPQDARLLADVDKVSPGYLETLGIELLDGRLFRDEDMDASHNTAIVNDIAAQRLWPGQSPLGKRVCLNCSQNATRVWKQVVGVVRTTRHAALDDPVGPELYYGAGALQASSFLVARSNAPGAQLSQAIRKAVATVDPKQPVFLSAVLSSFIADSVADRRFIMTLLATTAGLALLLSAAGIYGVISFVTSLRTQEIGVRIALGAAPHQVQALVFRQGMLLAGIGVAIGLASALILVQALRSALYGLASIDPALISAAVALVVLIASIACWIPSRRATRIDPYVALRQQ